MFWRILAGFFRGIINLVISLVFATAKGMEMFMESLDDTEEEPVYSPNPEEATMDYSIPEELTERHGPEAHE